MTPEAQAKYLAEWEAWQTYYQQNPTMDPNSQYYTGQPQATGYEQQTGYQQQTVSTISRTATHAGRNAMQIADAPDDLSLSLSV